MTWGARSVIGIDAGVGQYRAAQRVRTRTGQAWRTAILPRRHGGDEAWNPEEVDALGAALWRLGFVGRDVALALPDSRTLEATVELPPISSGAPIGTLASSELSRVCGRDIPEWTVTVATLCEPARARGGATRAYIAGYEPGQLDSVVRAFDRETWLGGAFATRRIEVGALATARALVAGWPEEGVVFGFKIGRSALQCVVCAEGRPLLIRTLAEHGLDRYSESTGSASIAERCVEELDRTVAYIQQHAPGAESVALVVIGGGGVGAAVRDSLRTGRGEFAGFYRVQDRPGCDAVPERLDVLCAAGLAIGAERGGQGEEAGS